MFRNILVPLDGSALADYALSYAARLARRTDATLHLVRVVEPLVMWQGPGMEGTFTSAGVQEEITRRMIDTARAHLRIAADRLARTGLCLKTAQLDGYTTPSLLAYEQSAHIDLVAMCSKGRTGPARLVFGSLADQLLRRGSAPILRVRPFGAAAILPQALVPLDGSPHAETALDVAEHLAQRQVIRDVCLLRVIGAAKEGPEAENYLELIGQRLERQGIACGRRVMMGDVAQSIKEQAATDQLVVMATYGRSDLARLVRGSVVDRVVSGNVAAVLLVRAGPKRNAKVSILPTRAERSKAYEQVLTRVNRS